MPDIRLSEQLSTFADSTKHPISEGGAWQQSTPQSPLKKTGGVATDSSHGLTNYSEWIANTYTTDDGILEVWGIPGGGGLGAAVESHRLTLWTPGAAGRSASGYLTYFGGGIGSDYVIRRYDSFVFTNIAISGTAAPAAMMLRIDGDLIQTWRATDGTFQTWEKMVEVSDTTYRGEFYVGLGIEDPTAGGLSWLAFGGGKKTFIPQIYRRPNE